MNIKYDQVIKWIKALWNNKKTYEKYFVMTLVHIIIQISVKTWDIAYWVAKFNAALCLQ